MNYGNPHFVDPEWLWLAVVGPVLLILLQIHAARQRRRQMALVAAPELLERMTHSHSPARRLVKKRIAGGGVFWDWHNPGATPVGRTDGKIAIPGRRCAFPVGLFQEHDGCRCEPWQAGPR